MAADSASAGVVAALITSGFAAVLGIFNLIERRFASWEKTLADRKSTELKAELDRVSERQRTEFSWLYTERAKAMLDIYARLINAYRAVLAIDFTKDSFDRESGDISENVRKAVIAGRAFQSVYFPKRILFDVNLAKKLDALNQAFANITKASIVPKLNDASDSAESLSPEIIADTTEAIRELESEFRKLYGYDLASLT
jgi:hypothetical protein